MPKQLPSLWPSTQFWELQQSTTAGDTLFQTHAALLSPATQRVYSQAGMFRSRVLATLLRKKSPRSNSICCLKTPVDLGIKFNNRYEFYTEKCLFLELVSPNIKNGVLVQAKNAL